jgi:YD repeat-containing protein
MTLMRQCAKTHIKSSLPGSEIEFSLSWRYASECVIVWGDNMAERPFQYNCIHITILGVGIAAALLMSGVADAATTYTYDGQGRGVQIIYDNGTTITYPYDAAGNRTTVSANNSSVWGSFTWGGANWH